jgi:hypothetical protein
MRSARRAMASYTLSGGGGCGSRASTRADGDGTGAATGGEYAGSGRARRADGGGKVRCETGLAPPL